MKAPPPPRPVRETHLHEAVADLLESIVKLPAMWTCFPAGNTPLPRAYAVKLARMGLKTGWPDFLIVHGKPYGIELKTVRGRLSKSRYVAARGGRTRFVPGQEDVLADLEGAGMQICIARAIEDVLAALQAWQIPTRGVRLAA